MGALRVPIKPSTESSIKPLKVKPPRDFKTFRAYRKLSSRDQKIIDKLLEGKLITNDMGRRIMLADAIEVLKAAKRCTCYHCEGLTLEQRVNSDLHK